MAGFIRVITGGMFSGKSQELICQIDKARASGNPVDVCYPRIAERQSPRDIQGRVMAMDDQSGVQLFALGTDEFSFGTIRHKLLSEIIAIDEAQFFSPHIVDVVKKWRHEGRCVLIAGLDMDYLEQPFGSMGDLMCLADDVVKLHATCSSCHDKPAFISHRVSPSLHQVEIGETHYVALCLECHRKLCSGDRQRKEEYGALRETARHPS